MKTTLAIDDDVMATAKELAAAQGKSIGEIISSLARTALKMAESTRRTRNGVPLLPMRDGASQVTPELVHQLREGLS